MRLSKLRTAVISDTPATTDVEKIWTHAIRLITGGIGPFQQDPKKKRPLRYLRTDQSYNVGHKMGIRARGTISGVTIYFTLCYRVMSQ